MTRRPLTPDDPRWSPVPRRTITDKLVDAVRLGVAQGVERHLDAHPDCPLHHIDREDDTP